MTFDAISYTVQKDPDFYDGDNIIESTYPSGRILDIARDGVNS